MNKKPMKNHKHSLIYSLTYDNSPLDERQRGLSTKIAAETLGIFSFLILINIYIMESFYKWCETFLDSAFIITGICLIYFVLRSGITGCLFGIKGVRFGMTFAVIIMLCCGIQTINNILRFPNLDDKPFEIIRGGMLTEEFSTLLYWGMYILYAILLLFFIIREKRTKKRKTESPNKEEKK